MDEPKEVWVIEVSTDKGQHWTPYGIEWNQKNAEFAARQANKTSGFLELQFTYRPRRYVPAEEESHDST